MGREEGEVLFWFDAEVEVQREGGRTASLTCNAVLCCIGQSSASCQWRGWGQRLTTAKESCRSDSESEREKVSQRVGE